MKLDNLTKEELINYLINNIHNARKTCSDGWCYFVVYLSPGFSLQLNYNHDGGLIYIFDANKNKVQSEHKLSLDEILNLYKHPAYNMAQNLFTADFNCEYESE